MPKILECDNLACLALVTEAFGGRGGIAQYNRDFIHALAAGPAVSPITVVPRRAPGRVSPPIETIVQARPRGGRLAYSAAALWAARGQVDIVFCGHLYMAPLAALIARLKRARLIVQAHGIEAWHCHSRIRRLAVEAADLILCVSRHTRAAVLSWAAIEPERVLVLHDTVSDAFTPGDGSALRKRWGLDGKRVLLTVGRMDARERYKGHDRIIQALPQLIANGFDVHYVILGDGDDLGRLRTMALDKGVSDRVHFKGTADSDLLVEAFRAADLFVMPSTGEGFGIAFLEAMASGTAVLGLAVAGTRDALGDGQLGTLVAGQEVASAIAHLLDRPKPDPGLLSEAVQTRFGRETFRAVASNAIKRLSETARTEMSVVRECRP